MAVGIDLDHDVEDVTLPAARLDGGSRRRDGIDENLQLAAAPPERQRLVQLVRRDAHRIKDVVDSRFEEVLRLFERGNRDAARTGSKLLSHDLEALRRLDVRPEARPERVDATTHAVDVAQ